MKPIIVCLTSVLLSVLPAFGARRAKAPSYYTVASEPAQYGLASWYGGRDAGRLMACGEPFNPDLMVAAHRTLPLGTRVRVTNLRNGRSVVVRIMDRGPAVAGRVIDLSRAAAARLRFTHRGLAPVRIRVLSTPRA
jgi:rare lipoprotein A